MASLSWQKTVSILLIVFCAIAAPIGMLTNKGKEPKSKLKSEDNDLDFDFMSFRDRILVVKLSGMIIDRDKESLLNVTGTSNYAKRRLRKAFKDSHVKAVLLRVNSPGGTVGSSQEIHDAIVKIRNQGKPVIVSMGDVAASGGYYISAPATKIFADPGTITGSIGVIMNLMNVQGLEQKLGITANVVKSGQFKDMGSPNRPMTEAERELLQGLIMDSYNQFVEAVSKGRNLPLDTVKKLADGRIYTGRQAKDVKLVDELGGYEDALTYIREECKKKYRIKDDLPTDEGPSLDFLNQLVQSGASFNGQTQGFNPLGQLFGTNEGIYAKQPLYLMQ